MSSIKYHNRYIKYKIIQIHQMNDSVEYLTIKEAANYLRISENFFEKLIYSKNFPIKLNHSNKVNKNDLIEWICKYKIINNILSKNNNEKWYFMLYRSNDYFYSIIKSHS